MAQAQFVNPLAGLQSKAPVQDNSALRKLQTAMAQQNLANASAERRNAATNRTSLTTNAVTNNLPIDINSLSGGSNFGQSIQELMTRRRRVKDAGTAGDAISSAAAGGVRAKPTEAPFNLQDVGSDKGPGFQAGFKLKGAAAEAEKNKVRLEQLDKVEEDKVVGADNKQVGTLKKQKTTNSKKTVAETKGGKTANALVQKQFEQYIANEFPGQQVSTPTVSNGYFRFTVDGVNKRAKVPNG